MYQSVYGEDNQHETPYKSGGNLPQHPADCSGNAARLHHINPDNALEHTNQKFIRRFNFVEEHSIKQGRSLKDMSLAEMDALWDEAKKNER